MSALAFNELRPYFNTTEDLTNLIDYIPGIIVFKLFFTNSWT